MIIDISIQNTIRKKVGLEMNQNSDFTMLSDDIYRVTKERLSVNTLKRLFGYIQDVETSKSTLAIIARYLGYRSWKILNKTIEVNNSHFNDIYTIYPKEMKVGTLFSITYSPNRELLIEVIDGGGCKIITSSGGKLEQADILNIESITLGATFAVKAVIRDGHIIGGFVGGIEGGVTDIHIIEE